MELGNQIKSLRQAKGLTQEALAEQFGVTAQAVSKWERNAALPDIGMLPQLSVLFGVTIDQLFAIPDEDRIDRIQNMLWDERVLDPVLVEREKAFLLEKARREPENGRPHELLADMENHLADEHRALAAEYAKEALRRDPVCKGAHDELVHAMGGNLADWCYTNHRELICWYQDFLEKNPDNRGGYMWLLDQLIDDGRLEEARTWLERMAPVDGTFRTPLYRGLIAWAAGERQEAMALWEQMCRDWPEDWLVWYSMGDAMARMGQYGRAEEYYRKCFELQPAPRYADMLESIAQARELAGDAPGAIAALEEEITLLADEWNTTTGETVDKVRREMDRLKRKL
ncbi:MAG: helix-turn-helix domain-containing protein [Oscillospiraceae bacterium]|nr:helix-turn-helix domain-containing protein [Oscillospiraceae bacterium]